MDHSLHSKGLAGIGTLVVPTKSVPIFLRAFAIHGFLLPRDLALRAHIRSTTVGRATASRLERHGSCREEQDAVCDD